MKKFHVRASIVSSMLAILTSGCRKNDGQSVWWQGEQNRVELTHDLALKEYRLQHSGYEKMAELEKFRISNKAAELRLRDLRGKQAGLILEVELMSRRFVASRREFVGNQRKAALGKKFNELAVADGRNFRDVAIVSIDDAGVTIRHADGSARLAYADFDEGQRVIFGLEEGSSLAAQEEEERQSLAYERLIDSRMAIIQQKQTNDFAAAKREEQQDRWQRSSTAASQANSGYVRPLAQPAKAFGGGFYGHYSGYSRRPIYYYVNDSNRYNFAPSTITPPTP